MGGGMAAILGSGRRPVPSSDWCAPAAAPGRRPASFFRFPSFSFSWGLHPVIAPSAPLRSPLWRRNPGPTSSTPVNVLQATGPK